MAVFRFYSNTNHTNFQEDVYQKIMDDSDNVVDDWELTVEIPSHYMSAFPEIEDLAAEYGGDLVEQ